MLGLANTTNHTRKTISKALEMSLNLTKQLCNWLGTEVRGEESQVIIPTGQESQKWE